MLQLVKIIKAGCENKLKHVLLPLFLPITEKLVKIIIFTITAFIFYHKLWKLGKLKTCFFIDNVNQ
jgi:hypothetical protein